MDLRRARWRKSSFSGGDNQCIELADIGLVRDSKNPDGPRLAVDLGRFVQTVKDGRL